MKYAYVLKGRVNNVFRAECLKCHASIIITEVDSDDVVERGFQAFCRDHRHCVRKCPTQFEISVAEDRADLEVSNFNNSDPRRANMEVMAYETTEQ